MVGECLILDGGVDFVDCVFRGAGFLLGEGCGGACGRGEYLSCEGNAFGDGGEVVVRVVMSVLVVLGGRGVEEVEVYVGGVARVAGAQFDGPCVVARVYFQDVSREDVVSTEGPGVVGEETGEVKWSVK
jgi:hypothetical protein